MSSASLENFESTLEFIVQDLLKDELLKMLPGTKKRFEKVLRYTLPFEAANRGYPILVACKEFCKRASTEFKPHLACILGWCWQLMQTSHVMMDDIFDNDEERWGKPTWYYFNGRNPIAVCETMLMQQGALRLLAKHFGNLPYYSDMQQLFCNTSYEFLLGQNCEQQATFEADKDFSSFTWDQYYACANYISLKTFFTGQFELAMIFSGLARNHWVSAKIKRISEELCLYANIRDDVNDSFGENMNNPIRDKDIREGKRNWLIVKAKEVCNKEEWKILREAYGKDDPKQVDIVKGIYVELGVPEMAHKELEKVQVKLEQHLNELTEEWSVIGLLLTEMYNHYAKNTEY